jgi:hypothetical protein
MQKVPTWPTTILAGTPTPFARTYTARGPTRQRAMFHWSERSERKRRPVVMGRGASASYTLAGAAVSSRSSNTRMRTFQAKYVRQFLLRERSSLAQLLQRKLRKKLLRTLADALLPFWGHPLPDLSKLRGH